MFDEEMAGVYVHYARTRRGQPYWEALVYWIATQPLVQKTTVSDFLVGHPMLPIYMVLVTLCA